MLPVLIKCDLNKETNNETNSSSSLIRAAIEANFRTSPAMYVVLAGDLVPAGPMLATAALGASTKYRV